MCTARRRCWQDAVDSSGVDDGRGARGGCDDDCQGDGVDSGDDDDNDAWPGTAAVLAMALTAVIKMTMAKRRCGGEGIPLRRGGGNGDDVTKGILRGDSADGSDGRKEAAAS